MIMPRLVHFCDERNVILSSRMIRYDHFANFMQWLASEARPEKTMLLSVEPIERLEDYEFENMNCERCGSKSTVFTMSMFCPEMLCMECMAEEEKHPRFEEAREAERAATRSGDYNFTGIGKPADLG